MPAGKPSPGPAPAAARSVAVTNRQRTRRVDRRLLEQIAHVLLADLLGLPAYELSLCLLAASAMTRLNETFVHHAGSTDVITFDYGTDAEIPARVGRRSCEAAESQDPPRFGRSLALPELGFCASLPGTSDAGLVLHGEIFICVDEALLQARRFHTSWPSEVVRYLVHGVLHLRGFDDLQPAARRRMKREEDRLHRALATRFALSRLTPVAKPQNSRAEKSAWAAR